MKVVVDSNVLISATLSSTDPPFDIIRRRGRGDFELVTSEALLDEYRRVLGYDHIRAAHRLSDQELDQRVDEYRRKATVVTPVDRLDGVERDESDNRFLECALAGEAEFVVSGDRHLLEVREYRSIQVLTPAAFVTYLDEMGSTAR